MPAPLKVYLTPTQDELLRLISQAKDIPPRTQSRATALRLSSRSWTVTQIAEYLKWHPQTVRDTIHRWNRGCFNSLWDCSRPGRRRRWQNQDIEYLEEKLLTEQRTYSSRQLRDLLKKYRHVTLGETQIREILKKRKHLWKRARASNKNKQNPKRKSYKQADFDMLQLAAACGEIRIKYLDEAGFSGWSNVSYTWAKKGLQKCLFQTKRRSRRISILGVFQPEVSFEYGLAVKGISSASFIKMMDAQAQSANLWWSQTNQNTVIVLDNYSIHKSGAVQAKIQQWSQQHLHFFYLPEYCCEWNRIEDEWHQIKEHEIAGRMFEDEYDLAMAVIASVEERGRKNGYVSQRFRFHKT